MCIFIKDDGEQCGFNNHDGDYCHIHEGMDNNVETDDYKNFSNMETVCDNCGTALRRCERLTSHPNRTRRVVFEAYVECDCDEYVLGTKSVREVNIPEGWR